MALNKRQQRYYTDLVDIYVPGALSVGTHKAVADPVYSLAYANVPCKYIATQEVDVPALPGLTKEVNIFTLDQFHFDAAQPMEDTYFLHLKTTGHPESGGYWAVMGNPMTIVSAGKRKANYRQVYGKRDTKPNGVQ